MFVIESGSCSSGGRGGLQASECRPSRSAALATEFCWEQGPGLKAPLIRCASFQEPEGSCSLRSGKTRCPTLALTSWGYKCVFPKDHSIDLGIYQCSTFFRLDICVHISVRELDD